MRRGLFVALAVFAVGCVRVEESVVAGPSHSTRGVRAGSRMVLATARPDGPGRTRIVVGRATLCTDVERVETQQTARTNAEVSSLGLGIGAALLGVAAYGLAARDDGALAVGVVYGGALLGGSSIRARALTENRPLPPRVDEQVVGTRPCGFSPAPGTRLTLAMGGVVEERVVGADGAAVVERAPSVDLTVLADGQPVAVWWEAAP